MKKFVVDEKFWELFPDANLGVLVLSKVDEKKKLNEKESNEIESLLKEANQNAKNFLQVMLFLKMML